MKVSVTPCTREGITTLGRGATVCFVRTKCRIYIQHVLGIWFRWSVFSLLRMNISDDSDTVLNCKAKREEVQKILVFFLEPRVICPFSDNPETECCKTFDSSECTCVLTVAIKRASAT
jgi:hypothetical protein